MSPAAEGEKPPLTGSEEEERKFEEATSMGAHIIGGSAETLFLVTDGELSFQDYLLHFMLPTLAGNIIGGVALVAAINHAQVVAGRPQA